MNCKSCGREAKMFWSNKEKTNGHSETFYRDLCKSCYVAKYNKQPMTLHEHNEKRKSEKQRP